MKSRHLRHKCTFRWVPTTGLTRAEVGHGSQVCFEISPTPRRMMSVLESYHALPILGEIRLETPTSASLRVRVTNRDNSFVRQIAPAISGEYTAPKMPTGTIATQTKVNVQQPLVAILFSLLASLLCSPALRKGQAHH